MDMKRKPLSRAVTQQEADAACQELRVAFRRLVQKMGKAVAVAGLGQLNHEVQMDKYKVDRNRIIPL